MIKTVIYSHLDCVNIWIEFLCYHDDLQRLRIEFSYLLSSNLLQISLLTTQLGFFDYFRWLYNHICIFSNFKFSKKEGFNVIFRNFFTKSSKSAFADVDTPTETQYFTHGLDRKSATTGSKKSKSKAFSINVTMGRTKPKIVLLSTIGAERINNMAWYFHRAVENSKTPNLKI